MGLTWTARAWTWQSDTRLLSSEAECVSANTPCVAWHAEYSTCLVQGLEGQVSEDTEFRPPPLALRGTPHTPPDAFRVWRVRYPSDWSSVWRVRYPSNWFRVWRVRYQGIQSLRNWGWGFSGLELRYSCFQCRALGFGGCTALDGAPVGVSSTRMGVSNTCAGVNNSRMLCRTLERVWLTLAWVY